MGTAAYSSWRELAEAAYKEHDSKRLMELISRLNDALEERSLARQGKRRDQPGAVRQESQSQLCG